MNYHIGRLVLGSLCVGAFGAAGFRWCSFCRLKLKSCASAYKTNTTQNQPHQISNTQRTENKTTDVVIQQHSRRLLKMDILMSETCWAHKKWNKIASDIKLIFHSSNIFCIFMTQYLYSIHFDSTALEHFEVLQGNVSIVFSFTTNRLHNSRFYVKNSYFSGL